MLNLIIGAVVLKRELDKDRQNRINKVVEDFKTVNGVNKFDTRKYTDVKFREL